MNKPPFTTVVRRHLGRRLRAIRDTAGITHEDVARAKIGQRTKLWRYESGQATMRGGDVRAMCHLYEVENDDTTHLTRLADASSELNYVEETNGGSLDDRYWMYPDLEELATRQSRYSSNLVPGLLQIPAYAHAVIAIDPGMGEKDVKRRVEARLRTQQAFFDRPTPGRLNAVIPASVLSLEVSSPEVMAEQIAYLVAADQRDEVTIRVLPGLHAYMSGMFSILDFDDPDDPSVVCLTSLVGGRYLERPPQVAAYRRAFGWMQKESVTLTDFLG